MPKIGEHGNNNLTFGDGCLALVSSTVCKDQIAKLCESRVEVHLVNKDVIPFVSCNSLKGTSKCTQGYCQSWKSIGNSLDIQFTSL